MTMLQVQGLVKRIGGFALEASFEVPSGERAVIMGPSGAGKSSLLRLLAGLDEPDRGRILLAGRDLVGLPAQARGVGLVFQDPALFPTMSVAENAAFGLRMRGARARERRRVALEWLERVGLAAKADEGVAWLSGGERSRLAFVRALAWRPELILLDEPFAALDAELRARMRGTLLELHRAWPAPLVMVTHDEEDAVALGTSRFTLEAREPGTRALSRL